MATLQEHLNQARKINPDRLKRDLFKFIKSIETELTDIEKERISQRSEDILGNPIGFYSKKTERLSGGRKKAGEPFTGVDTGDWFKGFFIKIENERVVFGSSDPKTSEILKSEFWLSKQLFGLTDDELKEVISTQILPFFLKNSREILGI
jgi:hypothetical protein